VTNLVDLQTLQSWLSPAFPVGAFAWSHGLETAILDGRLSSAQSVQNWITALLEHGSLWGDAVLFSLSARGQDVGELALALAASKERHAETAEQGAAFARTVNELYDWDLAPGAYPVVVAQACSLKGIPQDIALPLFLQATASNLISAAVRLIPLGQTDGQRITAGLYPVCEDVAERAATATEDDLGSASFRADIAAMTHETLPTRIFRS
jgi:urease accessory protein